MCKQINFFFFIAGFIVKGFAFGGQWKFFCGSMKSRNFFYPDELATLIFTKQGSLPSVTVVSVDLELHEVQTHQWIWIPWTTFPIGCVLSLEDLQQCWCKLFFKKMSSFPFARCQYQHFIWLALCAICAERYWTNFPVLLNNHPTEGFPGKRRMLLFGAKSQKKAPYLPSLACIADFVC